MTSDCHTIEEHNATLYADLSRLLEEGLSSARMGHWAQVQCVTTQMEAVAKNLAEAGHGEDQISGAQRMRLKELYNLLMVAVEAEREETQTHLKKLRGVKRAVGVYGSPSKKR